MTISKTTKVTTAERKLIERLVRKCMNELKKKKYELNITAADVDRAVSDNVLEVKRRRGSDRGGANIISINLTYWQSLEGKSWHKEYDSYTKDPVIGGAMTYTIEDNWMIQVAHEVSHHVQYRHCPRVTRFKSSYRKPHGDCFKWVYRQLRMAIVNPALEESRKAYEMANTVKMPVTIHAKSELFSVLSSKMDKREMPKQVKQEWAGCQSLAKGERVSAELLGHIIDALGDANRTLFYKSQLQIVGKRSVTKKRYLAGRRIRRELIQLAT